MIFDSKDVERFWSKVDKKSDDECWLWLAGTGGEYGRFWLGYHGTIGAHAFSFFLATGVDPRNSHIHHKCENGLCVNHRHLEQLTAHQHMLEGSSKCAKQARQTHCKRNHEFTEENTYIYHGMRHCRKCHALHQNNHMRGRSS